MSLLYLSKPVIFSPFINIQKLNIIKRYFRLSLLKYRAEQYYVVVIGRTPGIYLTWEECYRQISKYPKQDYKKFSQKDDALDYLFRRTNFYKEAKAVDNIHIELLEKIYEYFKAKDLKSTLQLPTDVVDDSDINEEAANNKSCSVRYHDGPEHIEQVQPFSKEECNEKEFVIDAEGYLVVYTDGACTSPKAQNVVAGLGVYFGPHNPLNASRPLEGKKTCVRAELCAAILALELAQGEGFRKIKIATDSQLLVSCATQWIQQWRRNTWLTKGGRTIANLDDMKKLDELMSQLDVRWVFVKGHTGVHGNEEADALATDSIKAQKRNALKIPGEQTEEE